MSVAPSTDIFSQPPPKSMPSYTIYDADIASSEKRKQQNRINFLKYAVQQTHKKSQNACNECYTSLSKIELAAFDCLVADYFLGDVQINELRDFIGCCAMPPFNLVALDRDDVSMAEQHIQYIYSKLQMSSQSAQRFKDHKFEPQKRPTELLSLLRDQRVNLERNRNDIRPPSQPNINQNQNISRQETPSSGSFYKWLNKNLKSDSQDATKLRSMIAKVSSKYNTIADLKEATETLRQAKIAPQTINYELCGVDTILHSPFISSVHSNYVFLHSMLNSIRSQKSSLIPRCQQLIARCQELITSVQQKTEKLRAESAEQSARQRQNLDQQSQNNNDMKKRLEPFARSLIAANDASSLNKYSQIADELDNEIAGKISKHPNAKELTNLLEGLRVSRKNAQSLAEREVNKMVSAAAIQKTFYNIVHNSSKTDELIYQNSRELELLGKYDKFLSELTEVLKIRDIEKWNQNITLVSQAFSELQLESAALAIKIEPLLEKIDENKFDEDVSKLEDEVNKLLDERVNLGKELTEAALNNAHAIEDLYQSVTEFTILENEGPNCKNEFEEKQIAKLQEKILCPCCKKNRRNCLISTCMHTICKNCMNEAGGACPVCGEGFDEDDVKSFWFQN